MQSYKQVIIIIIFVSQWIIYYDWHVATILEEHFWRKEKKNE